MIGVIAVLTSDFMDGREQALEYAEAALENMARHGVPQTPANFEVWYTHASGRDPNLSKALEILVSNDQPFTAEQSATIHERYFDSVDTSAAVYATGREFDKSMGTVLEFLTQANSDAEIYGKALENNLGDMANAKDLDALRRAVETLVSDTKGMEAQNSLLKNRLQDSSNEIESLRTNLESVQKEAMTDALTGIANRKFFDLMLRQAAALAMENGDDLSLAFGDIDHFKKFNDNYGHQTGDQVLKLVGMILTQLTEGDATAARYGGEEFAVILPGVGLDSAAEHADKIRATVASKRIRKKSTGEDFGNITMSIGVAQFRPGEPIGDLVHRADQALYHAKDSGRNCVMTEQELENAALEQ
jgi:diguanylate cyclase